MPLEFYPDGFSRELCPGYHGGSRSHIDRIIQSYPMKKVAEPVLCRGPADAAVLAACEELGEAFAAGLALGIY